MTGDFAFGFAVGFFAAVLLIGLGEFVGGFIRSDSKRQDTPYDPWSVE